MLSPTLITLTLTAASTTVATSLRWGPRRATAGDMLIKRQAAQLDLPNGVDLGSCTDPTMIFAQGLEGRTETTFQPNNLQEFNHGAAQNQNIITQFICDTFLNNCGANDAAVELCTEAEEAVANDDKVGATADKFNAFFGAQTNFAAVQAFDDQGNPVGDTSGDADNSAVVTQVVEEAVDCGLSSVDAAEPTATAPSNDDSSATAPAATSAAPPASGDNLQAFTGQLGGAAPSVSAGGRGFIVEGNDEFVGSGAALSRSCDVQHNACADEANSGGAFSVGDCDAQNNECKAANGI